MEFITLFGTYKSEPTVLDKIKDAVTQTKENFTERIQDLVQGKKEIDAEMLDELEAIILGNLSAASLRAEAVRQGMVTMFQDGIMKVLEGTCSLQELLEVAQGASEEREGEVEPAAH